MVPNISKNKVRYLSMAENKGYVHPEVLVDADWVEAHLRDPQVRLLEVDVDTSGYEQGHIPGAVGFNWQKELQDQIVRSPLSKDHLEKLLGDAGVDNSTTIVLYGDNNDITRSRECSAVVDFIRGASHEKRAAMNEDHHGALPAVSGRCPHIQRQAVLRLDGIAILGRVGTADYLWTGGRTPPHIERLAPWLDGCWRMEA